METMSTSFTFGQWVPEDGNRAADSHEVKLHFSNCGIVLFQVLEIDVWPSEQASKHNLEGQHFFLDC